LPCDDGSHTCRTGFINNDEIWEADGGPYLVSGDLTVRPWATLTIRPGTQVLVAACDEQAAGADLERVEITALGTLRVQGTTDEPVVFRSYDSPEPAGWYGLVVLTEPEERNQGASSIQGAAIQHAVYGVYNRSTLPTALQNNRIHHCSATGLRWESPVSPTLQDNELYANDGGGLVLINTSDALYGATVARNVVRDNGGPGVWVQSNVALALSRNTIAGNVGNGVVLDRGVAGSVQNNFFVANSGDGLRLSRGGDGALVVAHNTFHRNGGAGLTLLGDADLNPVEVRANIVTVNAGAGLAVDSEEGLTLTTNNVWSNGTNYQGASADERSLSANPVYVNVAGDDHAAWDLRITAWSPCLDRAPADDAPEGDAFGDPRGFDGDFDGSDGPDLGATEMHLATPAYQGEGRLGHVNVDTVWLAADGPYLITGDLYVAPHASLFVEAGTEVLFAGSDLMAAGTDVARVELTVAGLLEARGGKEHPIILRCGGEGAGCWYGVRFVGEQGGNALTDSLLRGARRAISVEVGVTVRPELRGNTVEGFEQAGIHWTSPVAPVLLGNTFDGPGDAIVVAADGDAVPTSPRIEGNSVRGCATAFGVQFAGVATVVANQVTLCDAGLVLEPVGQGSALVERNTFGQHVHERQYGGAGVLLMAPLTASVLRNELFGYRDGLDARAGVAVTAVNNLVYGNFDDGVQLGAAAVEAPSALLHNTIGFNGDDGVLLAAAAEAELVTVANNIVVDNRGVGLRVEGDQPPLLSSNDVWGNADGDYVGAQPDAASLSENPLLVSRELIEIPNVVEQRVPFRVDVPSRDRGGSYQHTVPNQAPAGVTEMRVHLTNWNYMENCCDYLTITDCNGRQLHRSHGGNTGANEWTTPWWTPGACGILNFRLTTDGSVASRYSVDWYEYRGQGEPTWDTSELNLRLQANSGAIEAGDPELSVDLDFAGEHRPHFPFGEDQQGALPDMGAFEFSQNIAPTARAGQDLMIEPGQTVHFDGRGSFDPDGAIAAYAWDFGDGTLGEGAEVDKLYPDEGEFTVTLVVTDEDGATGEDSLVVTVRVPPPNVPPVAAAGPDVDGFVGIPITFDGRGSTDEDGQIVSYAWNFGDGQTAQGPVVSHFYEALGSYTVTLTVTDDRAGQASDVAEVEIRPGLVNRPPVADAGPDLAGHEGSPIAFDGSRSTDADGIVVAWHWDFGDGAVGDGAFVSHTYAAPGRYLATLTVQDDDGAATEATVGVDVNARPIAHAGADRVAEAGALVVFDGSGSSDPDGQVVRWRWQFGDGQRAEGVQVEHAYAAPGEYVVRLEVTDDLGASADTLVRVEVTPSVNAPPVAVGGGERAAVVGVPLTFDASVSNDPDGQIVSYLWHFGDGETSTEPVVQHAYAEPGERRVTLTVTDDEGAVGTDQFVVTVRAENAPPVAIAGPDAEALVGEQLTFDGGRSGDPDGLVVGYTWDFGDGNEDHGPVVTHAYAAAGQFTVTLTVSDENGATGEDTLLVTVSQPNQPPVAEAGPELSGVVGAPVALDGSGSNDPDGQIVAWTWTLGDGTSRQGAQIEHTYVAQGVYHVTLVVTDDAGAEASDTTTVTVEQAHQPPVAAAGDDLQGELGQPVVFDGGGSQDPDGAIVAYVWDFGDGQQGEGEVAVHTYDAAGLYVATLTVTDDDGLSDTDTLAVRVEEVIVNRAPVASAGPDQQAEVGRALSFDGAASTDPDGVIVTHAWDFGDGEQGVGEVVVHSYAAAGLYVVTLTVTDDGGLSDTDTLTVRVEEVVVNQPPTASAGPDQLAEPGVPLSFDGSASSDPDGALVQYTWDFGDGQQGQGEVVLHTYAAAGLYVVTLTVTDDGGLSDTDTLTARVEEVVVNQAPVADAGPDLVGQANSPLSFDGSASSDPDGSIAAYAWDFGDGQQGDGEVALHTYAAAGLYVATLTVTDDGGLSDTDTLTVRVEEVVVNQPPVADAGPDQSGEVGRPLSFDGSGSSDPDGAVAHYAWDFGDGSLGSGQVTSHTYDQPGLFTVTLVVTDDGGATAQDIALVDLNALPEADIEGPDAAFVGETVRYTGAGSDDPDGDIEAYAWDFGDGNVAEGESVEHVFAAPGSYVVALTVTDEDGGTDRESLVVAVAQRPVEDAGPGDPDVGVEDPDLGTEDPDLGTEDPDLGPEDPDLGPEDPDLGTDDPDLGTDDPDLGQSEQDTGSGTPDAGGEGAVPQPPAGGGSDGGCSCAAAGPGQAGSGLGVLLLGLLLVWRRRR